MLGGVLAMVAGCGIAADDMTAFFSLSAAPIPDSNLVRIGVGINGIDSGGVCVSLPLTARATVNGASVDIENRGSPSKEFMGGCESVTFSAQVPLAVGDRVKVEITDLGLERIVEFENPLAPLSLNLVSPANGVLRPGDTAVVEWLPANDWIEEFSSGLDLKLQDATGAPPQSLSLKWQGHRLTFQVPSTVKAGSGRLVLTGHFNSATSRCDFDRCSHRQYKTASVPVTISVP